MKIVTNLEQSKKLAEILSIESADMYYDCGDEDDLRIGSYKAIYLDLDIPAWSLSALLKVICSYTMQTVSDGCFIVADLGEKAIMSKVCDEPVDACCDLIYVLHKNKLI